MKKIIALIIVTVTLVGPFQLAFMYNSSNSNMMNIIMFLLSMGGFIGSFVLLNSGKKDEAKH